MDSSQWVPLLASGGLAGVLTTIFTWLTTRNRTRVELTLSERDAFNKEQSAFREELRKDISRLREDLEVTRREQTRQQMTIYALEDEINTYRELMRQHGVPLPPRRRIWAEVWRLAGSGEKDGAEGDAAPDPPPKDKKKEGG
jgi:hypothetical protein